MVSVCKKTSNQQPSQFMKIDSRISNNMNMENGNEEATHQDRSRCCFQEWIQLQRQDLTHLLESLHETNNHDEEIKTLIDTCITHFEDYISTRSRLALEEASPFFAPTWCTSLEKSLLWITGCRPSIFIRLLYALTVFEVDSRLGEWLERMMTNITRNNLHIRDMSPSQMVLVNELHIKTIRAEETLTREMASLQEELADQPIVMIANEVEVEVEMEAEEVGEVNEEAEIVLKEHENVMKEIMKKADELRLNTLKEIMEILKPVQSLEFLVASKKLHLSLHRWGKQKDERLGRRYHS